MCTTDKGCDFLSDDTCKVAKGGFTIYIQSPSSDTTNEEDDEEEGSQDLYASEEDEEDEESTITKAQLEQNVRTLLNTSMSSLSTTLPNVNALYYRGKDTLPQLAPATDTTTEIIDSQKGGSMGAMGITAVVLAVVISVGILGIGTLIQKRKQRRRRRHDDPLETVGLSSISNSRNHYENQNEYDPSSYWNRGWENVTKTYDSAVEVCMEKVSSFRQDCVRVDSFRRDREEFMEI